MTTINLSAFTIDDTDPRVVRAAKLGSLAGIAAAEKIHAAGAAPSFTTEWPEGLDEPEADHYRRGYSNWGWFRYHEAVDTDQIAS